MVSPGDGPLTEADWALLRRAVREDDPTLLLSDRGGGRGGKVSREDEKKIDAIRAEYGEPGIDDGPIVVKRGPTKPVMMNLSFEAWEGCRRIAKSFGYHHGGHGNLTSLIEAIGQGKLIVILPEEPDDYHFGS